MANPIMTEAAVRRVIAEVTRLNTVRFRVPADSFSPWWRDWAYALEAVAQHEWLEADQPGAVPLVRSVIDHAKALENALSASPPELGGVSVLDYLTTRFPDGQSRALLPHMAGTALRFFRQAGEAAEIELRRAMTRPGPTASDFERPVDRAVAALVEAYEAGFSKIVDGEEIPAKASHTSGAKPGPFCRFAEAAIGEFNAAWKAKHPAAPVVFEPRTMTPPAVRRVVAALAASPYRDGCIWEGDCAS